MPEIPTFTATEVTQPVRDTAHSDPSLLAAPGLAQQRAGERLESQIGDNLNKIADLQNYQYVSNNWADGTTQNHELLQNEADKARQTGEYQGFAQRISDTVKQDLQQRLDNAPSATARAHLQKHFATLQDGISARASVFEHNMGQQDTAARLDRFAQQSSTQIARDPSLFLDRVAQGEAMLAGGDAAKQLGITEPLNPLQSEKARKAMGATFSEAALLGTDPVKALADLKAGKYDEYLDAAAQERIRTRLSGVAGAAIGSRAVQGAIDAGGGNWETQHNNLGGLRIPGSTVGPNAGGFQSFATPEAGVAAISHQLDRYASGATTGQPINTLRQIVSTWAPPSENDTATLIARAAQVTGFAPDQALNVSDPATKAKLIEATIRNEQGGRLPVSPDVISKVAGAAPPATAADAVAPKAQAPATLAQIFQRIDAQGVDPVTALHAKEHARMEYGALETEQLRQQRQADKAATDRSNAAENRIIADSRSDQPTITAKDVATMPDLKPDAKLRMIAFLAKDGNVDAGLSHQTAMGLMRNIADGSVTDQAPLIDAFGKGRLSWTDFDHLNKQLADVKTPAGEQLTKRKEEFIKAVTPEIAPKGVLGMADPRESERLYQFRWALDQKIDDYRKGGKDPSDLLNPSKPDYLGKPEALKPYRSPLNVNLSDTPPPQAASAGPDAGRAAPPTPAALDYLRGHPELQGQFDAKYGAGAAAAALRPSVPMAR